MPKRKLGNTDIEISALGLGCWQFSAGRGLVGRYWPALPMNEVNDIVGVSLAGGINWFDTAEIYGNGASERTLAKSLVHHHVSDSDVVIATKWWPIMRSASSIPRTLPNRKSSLSPYSIDLLQVHQPYSLSSIPRQMEEMAALAEAGEIRYVGVSNFSLRQMDAAYNALAKRNIKLVSNQVKYNLLNRSIEKNGVLDLAKQLGVTIIAYSPLEQGLLTGKFHTDPGLVQNLRGPRKYLGRFRPAGLQSTKPLIGVLSELATKYQVTLGQVALNWLILYHQTTVVAIPGASKVTQAEQNIKALSFCLSDEDMDDLNQMSVKVTS